MILYSQVHYQYCLTAKIKHSKISFEFNHEKADTRMIFHVLQQIAIVVVYSKDNDVLVVMFFVYALDKINEK